MSNILLSTPAITENAVNHESHDGWRSVKINRENVGLCTIVHSWHKDQQNTIEPGLAPIAHGQPFVYLGSGHSMRRCKLNLCQQRIRDHDVNTPGKRKCRSRANSCL